MKFWIHKSPFVINALLLSMHYLIAKMIIWSQEICKVGSRYSADEFRGNQLYFISKKKVLLEHGLKNIILQNKNVSNVFRFRCDLSDGTPYFWREITECWLWQDEELLSHRSWLLIKTDGNKFNVFSQQINVVCICILIIHNSSSWDNRNF